MLQQSTTLYSSASIQTDRNTQTTNRVHATMYTGNETLHKNQLWRFKNSYSSKDAAIPFQGILQGNGAGPTIWVLVSTPLLNMMRKADNGAHLLSAIGREAAHIVGYAFVDDTDLVQFDQRDI
jgi:hypothetical protein